MSRTHRFEIAGWCIILVAAVLLSFGAGKLWYSSNLWNPLGEYPLQTIQATQYDTTEIKTDLPESFSRAKLPVIYWNQTVKSAGIKCVQPGEGVVKVSELLEWVIDEPPGSSFTAGKFSGARGPGCITYEFDNPIPPEVRERLEALKAKGQKASVWHLSGQEVPERATGEKGEERNWITTSFVILHEDEPK